MAFEEIERVGPVTGLNAVPPDGLRVSARRLGGRGGGGEVRYIKLDLGAQLARRLSLTQERHNLKLAFGTGEDAGKIMLSVDNADGRFVAARNKHGSYAATINAASADGLFSLSFPTFAVLDVSVSPSANGNPPRCVFKASTQMLDVED